MLPSSFVCTYQGCFADGRIPAVGDFVAGVRNDTDARVQCFFASRAHADADAETGGEAMGVSPSYAVAARSTLLLQPAEWIALRGDSDIYLCFSDIGAGDDRVQVCLAHTQPDERPPVSLPMHNGHIAAPPARILQRPLAEPHCVDTQTGQLYVQCCCFAADDSDTMSSCGCTSTVTN